MLKSVRDPKRAVNADLTSNSVKFSRNVLSTTMKIPILPFDTNEMIQALITPKVYNQIENQGLIQKKRRS